MPDQITSENYVENVLRTDTPITPELLARLQDPQTIRLLHAAIGLSTESGEFLDMLKKHIFYGRPLDFVNAKEELGDHHWYAGLAVDVLRTTVNEILTLNIDKLRLRYPEKFSEFAAINRDVDKEQELLKDSVSKFGQDPSSAVPEGIKRAAYSLKGTAWNTFSAEVLNHIEEYVVPQYGDDGEDLCRDWTAERCVEEVDRYHRRFQRNSRGDKEQLRDLLKIAHYAQMAYTKISRS